jgi:hypothetical protein
MTTRDDVWHEILLTLVAEGKFRIGALDIDKSQRHTARRVLLYMEEMGWVYRTTPRSQTWRLGDIGRENLNVESSTMQAVDA